MTYAKIVADSISPEGVRLTTMEVQFHRFVLAEFNTHRVFSRNSASSRAIPFAKQLTRATARPISFPAEQKGMQGGDELDANQLEDAEVIWDEAAADARDHAVFLGNLGVHKSVVNRLLEPFLMHTVVVTSTAWENFFAQRCSPLAQPEIRAAAEMMQDAFEASYPDRLRDGDWHLPYVSLEEIEQTPKAERLPRLAMVSAARCARVSHLTQDGQRDMAADLELYVRLVSAQPAHWSPLEHVATPWPENRQVQPLLPWTGEDEGVQISTDHLPRVGNLVGWRSLRTEEEAHQGRVTFA